MKIKGSVLLAREVFVKKHFNLEAWDRVLQALPPTERELIAVRLSNVGWYPFEVGMRLDDAIVRILGRGNPKIFEGIGAASARENLATVHKSFLAPGNPQAFMAKAPIIYGFYYDTGRRTYEATGPNSCVLTTYDADTYSSVDCLTVVGWHKEGLAMCGARDVSALEETCRARGDAVCRYSFTWKM